jgi:TPR repeat protein
MAIEKGHSYSMINLGNYYKKIGNCRDMEKYLLLAIEKGNDYGVIKLEIYYKNNKLKLFNLLFNLKKKSKIVVNMINELTNNSIISNYIEKINLNKKNIKDCIVCYELTQHINFECGHEICINCYCSMDNCYYRCKKFRINELNM